MDSEDDRLESLKEEKFKEADWEDIYKRLLYYAHNKLKHRFFLAKSTYSSSETGAIAAEIVNEAVVKLIAGTRNWNPEQKPDLYIHLLSIVKSDIYNFFKKHSYIKEERIGSSPSDDGDALDIAEENLVAISDPDTDLTFPHLFDSHNAQDELIRDELMAELQKEVQGNSELELILCCLGDDIIKPADIAEETGIDAKRISMLKRQLRRVTERLLRKERKEAACD